MQSKQDKQASKQTNPANPDTNLQLLSSWFYLFPEHRSTGDSQPLTGIRHGRVGVVGDGKGLLSEIQICCKIDWNSFKKNHTTQPTQQPRVCRDLAESEDSEIAAGSKTQRVYKTHRKLPCRNLSPLRDSVMHCYKEGVGGGK